jgi:hypothetical protein
MATAFAHPAQHPDSQIAGLAAAPYPFCEAIMQRDRSFLRKGLPNASLAPDAQSHPKMRFMHTCENIDLL